MELLNTLNLDYNRLTSITGLEHCNKLKRLFLNKNNIQEVSGLIYSFELTELYLNDQNITDSSGGIGMSFDKDSMIGVSETLRILEIEGNKIWKTDNLEYLRAMERLKMGRNAIENVVDLEMALTCMASLTDLRYTGNPFEGKQKSRDFVLMMGLNIVELNGKTIMPHEREFLFKFHKKRQFSSKLKTGGDDDSEDLKNLDPNQILTVNGEYIGPHDIKHNEKSKSQKGFQLM